MPGPKRPRRRSLSTEDKALWEHVTQSVRRVDTDKQGVLFDAEGVADAPPTRNRTAAPKRAAARLPDAPASKPAPPMPLSHGTMDGMDRRTAQRLKRGKLDVEDRLDLHGHTQAAAHRALERFLHDGFMAGTRTVLVITGKGDLIGGRPGVLRSAVPRWFNEQPMRQWVAGFSYAAPKDGGDGALYVRLKRRKSGK